uniref:pleckstrin homology domain-containing family A member 8-like isoform X2 n=1 Tax=Styela clava TaxID=7725 RepID=UPI00193AC049|nr:pleckstrin homology domain-containing family A member 8-like isoform X2 [Styela clava]
MDVCDTDGMLYKWTNYWGGWQPRWFVLNNGIFAYYSCLEEINKGCKASLNISAGEVKVHPTDNTRFDIVLQHDQHWYLRASTPAERQKWLIALGTVKARKCELGGINTKDTAKSNEEIQTKVSELRLYCDLISNQVLQLKEEAQVQHPDAKVLTETSSMLVATCDTFLNTLTQCLSMTEKKFATKSNIVRGDDVLMALPFSGANSSKSREKYSRRSVSVKEETSYNHAKDFAQTDESFSLELPISHSAPSSPPPPDDEISPFADATERLLHLHISNTLIPKNSVEITYSTSTPVEKSTENEAISKDQNKILQNTDLHNNNTKNNTNILKNTNDECRLSFFTAMLHSFTDIVLEEDGGVPTTPFLSACDCLLPFFDLIGSTAFAPVKMDLGGNIKKIRTKQLTDPVRFCTLQSIVNQEIETNTTKVRNSATDALLWLKRGLRLVYALLVNIKNGEKDLTVALNSAYNSTLKPYHSWVVKGIFALAVKATPYYDDFLRTFQTESLSSDHPDFMEIVMRDIDQYSTAIDVVLSIVDNFYQQHALDSAAIV